MKGGTRKDLAALLGMTVQSVDKAIASGRIPANLVERRGRNVEIVDLEKAARAVESTTQVRVDHEIASTDDEEDLPAGIPPYLVSRAEREAWAARIKKLEAKKLEGELVSAADARSEAAAFRVVVRAKFLGATPRLRRVCPELSAEQFAKHTALMRQLAEELAKEEEELGDSP